MVAVYNMQIFDCKLSKDRKKVMLLSNKYVDRFEPDGTEYWYETDVAIAR